MSNLNDIMVETYVRIVLVTLISLVVVYYAYLLGQARDRLKQAYKNPTDQSMERIALLKQKLVPTVCYLLGMLTFGVLYLVGINLVVMSYVLVIFNVIVAFLGDKRFLSKAEFKNK
ncbi:hypothetical protein H9647_01350 [Paenibacillus sp. Sa2BVA9]|uniref:DUF3784 domain-containing protein n=2 Tax=Paenibacillus gallinarum TaxID=2762232 RepID=A0ABR8ST79_9BACL|nr:hypothetical protein [Paenibacillus gallinarum]